jgi:hypothetical protein
MTHSVVLMFYVQWYEWKSEVKRKLIYIVGYKSSCIMHSEFWIAWAYWTDHMIMRLHAETMRQLCLACKTYKCKIYILAVEKFHAQTSWGDRRDWNKDLLSSNYKSEVCPCSATDHQSGSEKVVFVTNLEQIVKDGLRTS